MTASKALGALVNDYDTNNSSKALGALAVVSGGYPRLTAPHRRG